VKYQHAVLALLSMLLSCASSNQYAYSEMDSCPSSMTEEQHESGVVRCRAMCSSYARDFAEFDAECKCRCAPGAGAGGYRAKPKQSRPWTDGQTNWTPRQSDENAPSVARP
jgi:hypothetical protein